MIWYYIYYYYCFIIIIIYESVYRTCNIVTYNYCRIFFKNAVVALQSVGNSNYVFNDYFIFITREILELVVYM